MKMTIENFFRTLLAAAFAVGLAREAFAASPGELHYQGKVTSSAGVPIPDGTVPVVFSLWDADTGGSQIGADISLPAVPVVNGVFSADFTPPLSSIQNNATVYLEVKVNGKTFNSPRRQKLVATAFALSIAADSVRTAEIKNGEVALIDMNTADVDTRYGTLGTVQTFTAAKTFSAAPSFSAAGTPFSVTNTGVVANLNADLLDGQTGSFYQSATNLTAGTLPNARVDGSSVTKMGNSFNGNGELVKFGAGTTNYPAGDGSAITNVNATGIANNAVDTNKIANGEVALIDMNTADVDTRYGTLGTVQTFTAAKTFSAAPSFSAVGSPFAVTNSGLVPNLNADLLDGQSGSFYQDAGNLNAGTIPSARIDSSSVTKMGNAFNGNNNLLQLGATGLIPNSLVDSSSVTKLGSVVNTSNGLLQLGGTGLIPNNVVDGSSITKMGNSFNGNNNLLQLGATGLVPNSAVDGSSITKMGNSFNGNNNLLQLGATGLVPNSAVDGSSITKMGNSFNGNNNLLQLSATGLVPNSAVDGSSITKMGNSFNGSNNLLRLGATGLVPNSAVDGSSITKMGNSFNGVGQLVKFPGGATTYPAGNGSALTSLTASQMAGGVFATGSSFTFPAASSVTVAGDARIAGNLTVGSGGNAIQQIYKAAFTFDAWPGNLSSNATSTVDKSVAGTPFSAGDPVFLGVNPTTFDPHIVISAYVLDSSTIRFVFLNTDSSSHTIGSLTYTVVVFN